MYSPCQDSGQMGIRCLLCRDYTCTTKSEIYQHVSKRHFGYCRFACSTCSFRAPFSDQILTHAADREHSLKPLDNAVTMQYTNAAVEFVTAQCLAVPTQISDAQLLAYLDGQIEFFTQRVQSTSHATNDVLPNSTCEISCLLCGSLFSRGEIYGHVSSSHFHFEKFSCSDCDFKSPYNDRLSEHADATCHNPMPVDTSAAFPFLSRLVNLIRAHCRAACEDESAKQQTIAEMESWTAAHSQRDNDQHPLSCDTFLRSPEMPIDSTSPPCANSSFADAIVCPNSQAPPIDFQFQDFIPPPPLGIFVSPGAGTLPGGTGAEPGGSGTIVWNGQQLAPSLPSSLAHPLVPGHLPNLPVNANLGILVSPGTLPGSTGMLPVGTGTIVRTDHQLAPLSSSLTQQAAPEHSPALPSNPMVSECFILSSIKKEIVEVPRENGVVETNQCSVCNQILPHDDDEAMAAHVKQHVANRAKLRGEGNVEAMERTAAMWELCFYRRVHPIGGENEEEGREDGRVDADGLSPKTGERAISIAEEVTSGPTEKNNAEQEEETQANDALSAVPEEDAFEQNQVEEPQPADLGEIDAPFENDDLLGEELPDDNDYDVSQFEAILNGGALASIEAGTDRESHLESPASLPEAMPATDHDVCDSDQISESRLSEEPHLPAHSSPIASEGDNDPVVETGAALPLAMGAEALQPMSPTAGQHQAAGVLETMATAAALSPPMGDEPMLLPSPNGEQQPQEGPGMSDETIAAGKSKRKRSAVCRECSDVVGSCGNSRAANLHARREHIAAKHSGVFPYRCGACGAFRCMTKEELFREHHAYQHPNETFAPQRMTEDDVDKERDFMERCFPFESSFSQLAPKFEVKVDGVCPSGLSSPQKRPKKSPVGFQDFNKRKCVGSRKHARVSCRKCATATRGTKEAKSMHVLQKHMPPTVNRFQCITCGSQDNDQAILMRSCGALHSTQPPQIQETSDFRDCFVSERVACFGGSPRKAKSSSTPVDADTSAVALPEAIGAAEDSRDVLKRHLEIDTLFGGPEEIAFSDADAPLSRSPRSRKRRKSAFSLATVKVEPPDEQEEEYHGEKSILASPTVRGRMQCGLCDQQIHAADVVLHTWNNHMDGEKRYACSICMRQQNRRHQLLAGCRKLHPEVEPTIQASSADLFEKFNRRYQQCFGKKPRPLSFYFATGAPQPSSRARNHALLKPKQELAEVKVEGGLKPSRSIAKLPSEHRKKLPKPSYRCRRCKTKMRGGIESLKKWARVEKLQAHAMECYFGEDMPALFECSKCGEGNSSRYKNTLRHVKQAHPSDPSATPVDHRGERAADFHQCFEACFPGQDLIASGVFLPHHRPGLAAPKAEADPPFERSKCGERTLSSIVYRPGLAAPKAEEEPPEASDDLPSTSTGLRGGEFRARKNRSHLICPPETNSDDDSLPD